MLRLHCSLLLKPQKNNCSGSRRPRDVKQEIRTLAFFNRTRIILKLTVFSRRKPGPTYVRFNALSRSEI